MLLGCIQENQAVSEPLNKRMPSEGRIIEVFIYHHILFSTDSFFFFYHVKKRKGIPKVTRIVSFHRETHRCLCHKATGLHWSDCCAWQEAVLCTERCSDEQPASLECSWDNRRKSTCKLLRAERWFFHLPFSEQFNFLNSWSRLFQRLCKPYVC